MQVRHEHEGWLIWAHSFPTYVPNPKSNVQISKIWMEAPSQGHCVVHSSMQGWKKNRRSQCRCLKICAFVQGMMYRNCHRFHEKLNIFSYFELFWYILDTNSYSSTCWRRGFVFAKTARRIRMNKPEAQRLSRKRKKRETEEMQQT